MNILGLDIGGTKCAVLLAKEENEDITFLDRYEIKTEGPWEYVIDKLLDKGMVMVDNNNIKKEDLVIGISCGGPLDSKRGVIMSPPNLPGWDDVYIVDYIYRKTNIKAKLKNDADACALAEWKYGAGKGYENLVFLTFGTGLGAGLILNNALYTGANNMAGEVGHIRLEDDGPVGYGKRGSFEGFCSGGGIAQLAKEKARELKEQGKNASFVKDNIDDITTKDVALAAKSGYTDAIEVFELSGKYFGRGLSIIIDILNPEIIIAGSIFKRSGKFLEKTMYEEIEKEALIHSRKNVKIVPAKLGEEIGDYGAVVAALV
ncbi:MAG TPA: ROK family protein [Tissierellaceae bacterium]